MLGIQRNKLAIYSKYETKRFAYAPAYHFSHIFAGSTVLITAQ